MEEEIGLLEIEVVEVMGKCPVHKVGDKIVVDGFFGNLYIRCIRLLDW